MIQPANGRAKVNDYANVLSDSEELKLNERLQKIKDKYGFDAVIVTTDSYNGMSASDYADDFYDYNGYSKDGLIFVLNLEEREWYVATKGKAITYFTDYGIDVIFEGTIGSFSFSHSSLNSSLSSA